MRLWTLGLCALLAVLGARPRGAAAHGLEPAVLTLTEQAAGQFHVALRLPEQPGGPTGNPADSLLGDPTGDPRLRLRFPAPCRARGALLDCGAAGLWGGELACDSAGAPIEVLLLVQTRTGQVFSSMLRSDGSPLVLPRPRETLAEAPAQVLRRYLKLGVLHIAGGPDHLLFVAGLLLLAAGFGSKSGGAPAAPRKEPTVPPSVSLFPPAPMSPVLAARGECSPCTPFFFEAKPLRAGRRRVVLTITAFTVGHSVTLALAVVGTLRPDPALIEVLIALSILLLWRELAVPAQLPSLTRRFPAALALVFGLLHGLGFASALTAAGLPDGQLPLALLGFNLGVELGQLGFVLAIGGPLRWLRGVAQRQQWLAAVPVYALGGLAMLWTLQRLDRLFAPEALF